MAQWIEFISNHYALVAAFSVVLGALLVTESRKGGQGVSPQQAVNLMNKSNAVVLDVRPAPDFAQGNIVNAINIPFADIAKRMSELDVHRNTPIIVACALGQHSGTVGSQLKQAGFEVMRLSGGMSGWRGASMPVVKA